MDSRRWRRRTAPWPPAPFGQAGSSRRGLDRSRAWLQELNFFFQGLQFCDRNPFIYLVQPPLNGIPGLARRAVLGEQAMFLWIGRTETAHHRRHLEDGKNVFEGQPLRVADKPIAAFAPLPRLDNASQPERSRDPLEERERQVLPRGNTRKRIVAARSERRAERGEKDAGAVDVPGKLHGISPTKLVAIQHTSPCPRGKGCGKTTCGNFALSRGCWSAEGKERPGLRAARRADMT